MKMKGGPAVQVLDASAEKSEFSLIPNETLLSLYADLLQRQPAIARGLRSPRKLFSRSFGAAHVAIRRALAPGDTARMAVKRLPRTAGAAQKYIEFQPTADLLDVLGAALGNSTRKNAKVALVWATEADPMVLRTALEAARAHKLPLVFVMEMTGSGERGNLAGLLNHDVAPGDEMPHIAVDGNDVVAVYRVAHEAIGRARRDRGPSLIECCTYRVKGQSAARHLDPVANIERYLRARGLLTRKLKRDMLTEWAVKSKRSKK